MRVAVLVASALLCTSMSACSTKKKLDGVLDNADKTLDNANKRIEELSDLANSLKDDLSEAAKETSDQASQRLSRLGESAGNVPESGGEPLATDESVDLDEDGTPDSVSAVEYEDQMLWLAEASTFANFACSTQLYFVSDKPPENLLSWGLYAEACGAMACPPEELSEEEPDFDTCSCADANDQAISCQDFLAVLGGSDPGDDPGDDPSDEELVYCDDELEVVPVSYVCDGEADCTDGSDEAYCGS